MTDEQQVTSYHPFMEGQTLIKWYRGYPISYYPTGEYEHYNWVTSPMGYCGHHEGYGKYTEGYKLWVDTGNDPNGREARAIKTFVAKSNDPDEMKDNIGVGLKKVEVEIDELITYHNKMINEKQNALDMFQQVSQQIEKGTYTPKPKPERKPEPEKTWFQRIFNGS
jgi:hypothetical protein